MPGVPREGPPPHTHTPWDFYLQKKKKNVAALKKKKNRFFFLLALFLMAHKPLMRAGEQADFWGAGSLAPWLVVSRQAGAAEIPPSRLPRTPAGSTIRVHDQGPRPRGSSFLSFLTTSAAWLRQQQKHRRRSCNQQPGAIFVRQGSLATFLFPSLSSSPFHTFRPLRTLSFA